MTEPLLMAAISVAGGTAVLAVGIRSVPGMVVLSFPVGLFAYVVLAATLLIVRLPAYPIPVLLATLTIGSALAVYRSGRNEILRGLVILAIGAGTFASSHAFIALNRISFTVDSFRVLVSAGLLADHGNLGHASALQILTRGQALPQFHALAYEAGNDFLVSGTPLLAVATLLSLAWFGLASDTADSRALTTTDWGVAVMVVIGVGSMSRFVFHATYVHTHLMFATAVLMFIGIAWRVSLAREPELALPVLCALAGSVLVVLRPEGSLYTLILIAPVLVSGSFPLRHRTFLLAWCGAFMAGWNAFVVGAKFASEGAPLREDVWGVVLIGGTSVVLALLLLRFRSRLPSRTWPLHVMHGALWGLVAVFALRQQKVFLDTVIASATNVWSQELGMRASGLWGPGLLGLVLILIIALTLGSVGRSVWSAQRLLWFPVLAFVPFFLLLPHLREAPFRVGPGDSGTRMLFHIVPLIGLWLIVAARRRPLGVLGTCEVADCTSTARQSSPVRT